MFFDPALWIAGHSRLCRFDGTRLALAFGWLDHSRGEKY